MTVLHVKHHLHFFAYHHSICLIHINVLHTGVISSYGLWMDGSLVQNSSLMSFEVGDLSPWSPHSFRVQACTAQGCALGPLVRIRHIYIMLIPPLCVRWQLNIIKVIDSLCSIKHLLLTLDIWYKCHSGLLTALMGHIWAFFQYVCNI